MAHLSSLRLWPCALLLVLAALVPCARAITAADVLPFRPGSDGCYSLYDSVAHNTSMNKGKGPTLDDITKAADVTCATYGAGWKRAGVSLLPFANSQGTVRNRINCRRCGLTDSVLLWFDDEPRCKGSCFPGWNTVSEPKKSGPIITQSDAVNQKVPEDPYFGKPCSGGPGKVLCALPGRKECDGCQYTWRGVPVTEGLCSFCYQDRCNSDETKLASDKYAGGRECINGLKSLCEKCAVPVGQAEGASAAAAKPRPCFKRTCSKPKRNARFLDKPAYMIPGVTTYAGCCKHCRSASGCVRFQISAKGCSIYRIAPRHKSVKAAGYVVGYNRLA